MPKWNYILDISEWETLNRAIHSHTPDCAALKPATIQQPRGFDCNCGYMTARELVEGMLHVLKGDA